MNTFSDWANFCVIAGSSAGALIGLQFVVMTLLADIPMREGSELAGSAFGTPNVVHFCAVLLLAAFVCAPWHSASPVLILLGAMGIAGLLYTGIVFRRFRSQTAYDPEAEDWWFHVVLPFIAYAVLAASALVAVKHLYQSMFGVGATALLLLFVGIHNAWDAVTYHVFVQRRKRHEEQ